MTDDEKQETVAWLIEKIREQEHRLMGLRTALRCDEYCDDAIIAADALFCNVMGAIDELFERIDFEERTNLGERL